MKKEVQALLKRRRARFVPVIFAALAGLVIVIGLLMAVNFFTTGAGQALLRSPTPTPTLTFTPGPPTATPSLTFTPGPPSDTPGPSPTPAPITYTVQSGDTLFGIAQQFQVDLCVLMAVNQITDPTLVGVGTVLTVPLGGADIPTSTPWPADLPRGTRIQYVVECGDTLQSIADRFNTTMTDIIQRNRIEDPNNIAPGQVLEIRVNIATATPTATTAPTP
jgi:LysM repeat protein